MESLLLHLQTGTALESAALGSILGQNLSGGEILALSGDLGAGKTTLSKGIIEGAGGKTGGASPTFVIDAVYTLPRGKSPREIHHIDFYRLKGETELITLGFNDLLTDQRVCLIIEWANLFPFSSERGRLEINITTNSREERELVITAKGTFHKDYLKKIAPLLKPYYAHANRKK